MDTDHWGSDKKPRKGTCARTRTMWRLFSTAGALAAVVATVLVTTAAAVPKQIVFSGELRGISVDVGFNPGTGDTFHTTGGTFTATAGLKSGTYTSTFTLGSVTFPNPTVEQWPVTGTFTLETNGGSFTAAVIPASSFAFHAIIPGDAFNRRFHLELQVVDGTGRFKKVMGTLTINFIATMCGLPPGPDPPECPSGTDPIRDWFTHSGTVTGTLTRES